MKGKLIQIVAWTTLAVIAFLAAVTNAQAQDVTPEDLAQMREIIAERNFYKAKAELEERLKKEWQGIASDWEEVAKKEKDRADIVQGERIKFLEQALGSARLESETLRGQIKTDQEYIQRLERRVSSLKNQRLIFGAIGFAAGTAIGGRIRF